jgi:hypothetical protein
LPVEIRQVTYDDDYQAVARLRYDIYVEEMGKRPAGTDDHCRTLTDSMDAHSVIYAAFDGGRAVATGRITPAECLPEGSYWRRFYEFHRFPGAQSKQVIYSRLMVRPDYRGSMVMPGILVEAYERFRSEGKEFGFLHCAPSLVSLYEMVGCRRYKKGEIDPDAGFRIPMVQVLGDVEYFSRVRAPILRSVRKFPPSPDVAAWFGSAFPQYSQPASIRLMGEEDFLKTMSAHINHPDSPLFEGLSQAQVQQLSRGSALINADAGDPILRCGDVGSEMYLILDGAVEISVGADAGRRVLSTLGYGQFFGEGGFLLRQARSADAHAIAATHLLSISAENFQKIQLRMPELAAQVLLNLGKVLCRRLYAGN